MIVPAHLTGNVRIFSPACRPKSFVRSSLGAGALRKQCQFVPHCATQCHSPPESFGLNSSPSTGVPASLGPGLRTVSGAQRRRGRALPSSATDDSSPQFRPDLSSEVAYNRLAHPRPPAHSPAARLDGVTLDSFRARGRLRTRDARGPHDPVSVWTAAGSGGIVPPHVPDSPFSPVQDFMVFIPVQIRDRARTRFLRLRASERAWHGSRSIRIAFNTWARRPYHFMGFVEGE